MTPQQAKDAAIDLLGKLIDQASWYLSAIELDDDLNGEELLRQAVQIVEDAREESV